jgi:Tol biopolymer transport system component
MVRFLLLLLAGASAAQAKGPKLFAPGIVSTEDDEVNGGFSPDGRDYYFARVLPYTTFPRVGVLFVTHLLRGSVWSEPEVLSFSGAQVYDTQPRLSPDGQQLFFTSSRPAPGKKARGLRIWRSQRAGQSWSEPEPMPEPVNSEESWNWGASVTRDGTLYFASDREERFHPQLYRSRLVEGVYEKPAKLGPEINSKFNESDAFVSADESILIFNSSGGGAPDNQSREGTLDGHGYQYPRGDLYVSVRRDGAWTPARHLEAGVNTEQDEGSPSLSADGKVLFFSSERSAFTVPSKRFTYAGMERELHSVSNGHGNIYSIPMSELGL